MFCLQREKKKRKKNTLFFRAILITNLKFVAEKLKIRILPQQKATHEY